MIPLRGVLLGSASKLRRLRRADVGLLVVGVLNMLEVFVLSLVLLDRISVNAVGSVSYRPVKPSSKTGKTGFRTQRKNGRNLAWS